MSDESNKGADKAASTQEAPLERDKLMDHNYDGIQEYDNPLPGWWTFLFWVTIAFAPLYAIYYHAGSGPLVVDEYQAEQARVAKLQSEAALKEVVSNENLAALIEDAGAMQAAKGLFAAKCAVCHAADGGGSIGPNLTDDYYLHGGELVDLYKTINEGVPDKGMVAWGKQLKPLEIRQLSAYLRTLVGTTPAKPKAAQGKKQTFTP